MPEIATDDKCVRTVVMVTTTVVVDLNPTRTTVDEVPARSVADLNPRRETVRC